MDARGLIPIPGAKTAIEPLNPPIVCGGVTVHPGDMVVADDDGIVVVPHARTRQVLTDARAKLDREAGESLEDWQEAHRARLDTILRQGGFTESPPTG